MKLHKPELTNEIYEELQETYGKIVAIGIEDDEYILRYPNRTEFNALKQIAVKSQSNPAMSRQAETIMESLLVWPVKEVIDQRKEVDGGLMDLISGQFLGFYMNRAIVDEKKRL